MCRRGCGEESFLCTVYGYLLALPHAVCWQHFKEERQGFLDWLAMNHIDGVIFLSGDRHRTELLKIDRPGAYPLHVLTCSPLTSQPRKAGEESRHPQRVEGTLAEQRNFCTLDFTGEENDRRLMLRSFGSSGRKLREVKVAADSLKTRQEQLSWNRMSGGGTASPGARGSVPAR